MPELSPSPALAVRIEQALASNGAAYGTMIALTHPTSQGGALAVGGGWAVRSGLSLPINRAIGMGMRGPIAAATLDQAEAFYRGAGLPPEVELCPLADPSLHTLLRERGYQFLRFMQVLARGLGDVAPATSGNIEVSAVSQAQLPVWAHTVARSFAGGLPLADDDAGLLLASGVLMRPNVTGYLAAIGDEPVGAGALAIGGGVALLFSTATLPAFRRRGVHAALVAARLAAAAAAGCDIAAVQAVPGSDSQRNLLRCGFRVAYTNVILRLPV